MLIIASDVVVAHYFCCAQFVVAYGFVGLFHFCCIAFVYRTHVLFVSCRYT